MDLDLDWYTYLTEDFKLDRSAYKTSEKAVFDCPECGGTSLVRIGHIKTKIKALRKYVCSKCRKQDSLPKARAAFKAKYGKENPFEVESVKAKIKATTLKRYGVTNVLKLPEIHKKGIKAAASIESRQKAKVTLKKNYGVDCPLELHRTQINETLKRNQLEQKTRLLPVLLKELKASGLRTSNTEICEKLKVSYTTLLGWLRDENLSHLIAPSKIASQFQTDLATVGAEIGAYIRSRKIAALGSEVSARFKLSGPSIRLALVAAGNEKLIGRFKSAKQLALYEFIQSLGIEAIYNTRKIISPQELDIYMPESRIGIEFNGLYWHSEYRKNKDYHALKLQKCINSNVSLIQVLEDEWDTQRPIVESIIKAKLGLFNTRIFARKCTIKIPTAKEANDFLLENHLMGAFNRAKHLGLYYEDELVSLISYKKYKNGIDISRFCSKLDTVVLGGIGRLLKQIERSNPEATFIQSFVDLRYGTGASLLKTGFELKGTTLGWKWTDCKNTFNRLKCRANMDARKLSQDEHASELGWVKIYDAGQAKFVRLIERCHQL